MKDYSKNKLKDKKLEMGLLPKTSETRMSANLESEDPVT